MEKLSVIILHHNNIGMTRKCLESLSDALSDLDHEVILLDNGSTENAGSLEECTGCFRRFIRLRSDENLSFSIGNNRCVRASAGRWLLFLNNDVFLRRDTVKRLVATLAEDESIGVAGGKLLFPGEETVQHAGIGQMLWGHPSNYGVGANPADRRIQQKCERFALTGAMLCARRDIFEKVGGFDERYIWGTEDVDLSLKIRSAGYGVVYCPDAVAVHCESATLKIKNNRNAEANCALYRKLWDPVLIPAEQKYVHRLKDQGIQQVAVFGTGSAARGLAEILNAKDIQIACFTSSYVQETEGSFLGRPVLPLDWLKREQYDRLMVASQYFFEVESKILSFDPLNEPIYPMLN